MYKHAFWTLILLSAFAAGCTEKVETPSSDAVCIEASIADTESRTSLSGNTTTFSTNDKIGLFETLTGQSNISYTYNGTAWSATSSPAYWRDNTSTHTFYAYYPQNASVSGTKVALPTLATQSVGTTQSTAMDMLVAGPVSQIRSSGVSFTGINNAFKHTFAVLQFNVKLGTLGLLNAYNINSVTVRGGNLSTSSSPYGIVNKANAASDLGYDLVTKTIQASDNDSQRFSQSFTGTLTNVTVLYTAVTIYVYVLPGTYANPVPAVSFNLSLLGILLPSDSSFANLSPTTFQAGTKYTFNVSIGGLLLSSAPEVMLVPQDITPIDFKPFNAEQL